LKERKSVEQRWRKRLKRVRKAGSKFASRVSASFRSRIEHVLYPPNKHDSAKFDRAVSRSVHLPRPDFIIIGAPKCGTSWLQRALGQHPGILMVPDEIEYFSMHLDYPLEWYLNHFARAAKATRSGSAISAVMGEKSARYCAIEPDRVAIVHRLLPDARLILMTRDPVARHWSQAKRFFSKRRFNKREGGVFGVPRQELFDFFERMRPLGEFSTMIANWTRIYPPERLLIVSQEKALERPREAYDAVLAHIGATTDYDPAAIKLLEAETNLGPKLKMPEDIGEYLEAMFGAERDRLRGLLGDRTSVYVESIRQNAS
jgi:sulfotransferase family protein